MLAGGLGFEPRLAESESAVLPLDDPPTPARELERRVAESGRNIMRRWGKFKPCVVLIAAAAGELGKAPKSPQLYLAARSM